MQYAKRVVGRRVLGGQSTHLPLARQHGRRDSGDFRIVDSDFPADVRPGRARTRCLRAITDALRFGEPLYNLLYVAGIIFFCYFYTSIIFNPNEVADNMRKYGGFIPGIRPGKRTAEYVNSILTRITLVGALYLALIAIIPEFMITGFHVQNIPLIGPRLDAVLPQWITQGLRVQLLLRRHVAVDRRWRGNGYCSDGRVAVDHASL